MRLLVDTHAFLWFANGQSELSSSAQALIESPENTVLLSVASLWEMAIKMSLTKLTLPKSLDTFVLELVTDNTITLLPIFLNHVAAIVDLPLHHKDPFDRMLIAQAKVEQILIISRDEAFDAYGVKRLW